MTYSKDLDFVSQHTIDGNIWPRMKDQLVCALNFTFAISECQGREAGNLFANFGSDALCGDGFVFPNVTNYSSQVAGVVQRTFIR